jgi:hypothetical protein
MPVKSSSRKLETFAEYLFQHPVRGYEAIEDHFKNPSAVREVGVVLPVGCGKSGLIAISPFGVKSIRTLVIAPGLRIAEQLFADSDPTKEKFFYKKCAVLSGTSFPEPAEIRGATNRLCRALSEGLVSGNQLERHEVHRHLEEYTQENADCVNIFESCKIRSSPYIFSILAFVIFSLQVFGIIVVRGPVLGVLAFLAVGVGAATKSFLVMLSIGTEALDFLFKSGLSAGFS